ncbi:hypothetical protein P5G51_013735 [Virgibacillus sp. 179-BFC.A HS]|uniref:Uncharacterized protein n=1 Tax=Tigheibacillus jepli TaxID=3035914 RepID=A0ABU5CIY1_9BACI|nr:hypothetical protein [Virgibacillus sp. 179-BFC.A HS]MDY0406312.1 hypothetical protein [Virgibacillus sp. 179-BFC.A HS]
MVQPEWRRSVKEMDAYIPGKSIEDVKNSFHLEKVIRLASNENQFGPSKKSLMQ